MVTINLYMGEQDGAVLQREDCPPLLWVDSFEAQKIRHIASKSGKSLDDDAAGLPRLPYVLTRMEKDEGVVVSARYDYCSDILEARPATEEDESAP